MSRLSPAWPLLAGDTAADALVYVTLGWLAVQTGDLSASMVLAVNTAPAIALMLLGGAIGDRLGVVRVATWSTTGRALVLVAFAVMVATGLTGAIPLLAVALTLGIIDAVHQPAVLGVVSLLAERGQQRSSQAMVMGVTRTVGVVGSVSAGFLLGRAAELPLAVAAGCLAVAAIGASRVPRVSPDDGPAEETESSSLWRMTREGIKAVKQDRMVIAVLVLLAMGNFAATAPLSLGVPFLADEHSWSGGEYGAVFAGFGLGQVVGSLTLVGLRSRGLVDETRLGLGVAGALLLPAAGLLVAFGHVTSVGFACLALAGVGLLLAPGAAILMGYARERTPTQLVGRLNAFIGLAITASIPLGMLVFGLLVQARDVELAITVAGVALAGAALVAALVSRMSSGRHQSARWRSSEPTHQLR